MKDAFRQSMAWLHTWLGVLVGWLLYFMFITGTAGYLDTEIDRWMRPELPVATVSQTPLKTDAAIRLATAYLSEHAHGARRWSITLPIDRNAPYLEVSWQAPRGALPAQTSGSAYLDPTTGAELPTRNTAGGQTLYQMHWKLHYLPQTASEWIVGIATVAMLIGLVTGIVVHKKIFKDFFTFRYGKGQRSWLDAHNAVSVLTLPFQLMITYSGLVFVMFTLMPLIVAPWYGPGDTGRSAFLDDVFVPLAPAKASNRGATLLPLARIAMDAHRRWSDAPIAALDIQNPFDANARVIVVGDFSAGPMRATDILAYDGISGDLLVERHAWQSGPKAFRDLMLGLHEGQFAPPALRLLYVLSGLLGAAMIATGMVLWVVKRRQRADRGRPVSHAGLRLVERLNVAAIIGLPIAIAAYFWANRLVPVDLKPRASLEVDVLFLAWLIMALHASLRPLGQLWKEQSLVAAGMFCLLPLVNAMTTNRHLGRTIMDGDWVLAGFDLTMLGLGAMFCGVALKLRTR
ncbi:membrane protein [Pigmentiphaga litoralis]|uniref:PepSY-associated TM helix domain-containing protein n=1 Tax=Pigmentiphaga litoralis TaxID=516702 RepID=UPI00167B048F|nr:PepSY-associated TM helix domain-containing protein [Pigmentiphaga litoralis]GGX17637.1 membrane protein [Pigmentiphaga litoralis]